MGKDWDEALPNPEIFEECLRVLKPGGFAFVMSAPRSDVHSRMCILLEEAGFNISFTPIAWAYGTGFPKALNISKNISKSVDKIEKVDIYSKHGDLLWENINSKVVKNVETLLKKNQMEAGILTILKGSVQSNVQMEEITNKLGVNVNTVEIDFSEAHHTLKETNTLIAIQNADISEKQNSLNVGCVELKLENQNHLLKELKIVSVPISVQALLCEEIEDKIREGVVQKIENGNGKYIREMDINALCVEILNYLKPIILNLAQNTLNFDMNYQMELQFAMNVIITKSIMEPLITNTVDILKEELKLYYSKFDGAYAGMQVKPAWENVIVCMKPLSEKSYLNQALDNGGGITWLDDVRVPFQGMNGNQSDSDRRGFTERSSIKEGEVYSEAYGNEAQQWGFKKPISKDYEQYTKDNVGAQEEFNTDTDGLSRGKHPSRKKKTDQEKFEAAKGNNPKNYKEGRGWDQWGLEEEKHNFSNLTDEEAIEKFGTLENYKKWRRDNLAPGEDRRLIDGGSWDTSKMAKNVYSGGYSGKRVSAPMKKKKSDYDKYVEKQKSFAGAKTIGKVNEGGNTFLGGDMKQLDPSDTYQKPKTTKRKPRAEDNVFKSSGFKSENNDTAEASSMGRFPANLLVSDNVLDDGKIRKGDSRTTKSTYDKGIWGNAKAVESNALYNDTGGFSRYFSLDEWWKQYFHELPEEVQRTFPFLIVPKASKSEKQSGLEKISNVKYELNKDVPDDILEEIETHFKPK